MPNKSLRSQTKKESAIEERLGDMDAETFRRYGHSVIDMDSPDYLSNSTRYPVLARVAPGDVRRKLPEGGGPS